MNAKLENSTVSRIEDNIDSPISRGMDKAINLCLDELEELKQKQNQNGKVQVGTCDRMEELTSD